MRNQEFVVEYRRITIFDCRTVNAGAMRSSRPTKHLIANRTFNNRQT